MIPICHDQSMCLLAAASLCFASVAGTAHAQLDDWVLLGPDENNGSFEQNMDRWHKVAGDASVETAQDPGPTDAEQYIKVTSTADKDGGRTMARVDIFDMKGDPTDGAQFEISLDARGLPDDAGESFARVFVQLVFQDEAGKPVATPSLINAVLTPQWETQTATHDADPEMDWYSVDIRVMCFVDGSVKDTTYQAFIDNVKIVQREVEVAEP